MTPRRGNTSYAKKEWGMLGGTSCETIIIIIITASAGYYMKNNSLAVLLLLKL